jgi:hypothetical protein
VDGQKPVLIQLAARKSREPLAIESGWSLLRACYNSSLASRRIGVPSLVQCGESPHREFRCRISDG